MQKFFQDMLGHFLPNESNAYRPHLLRKPWLLLFFTMLLTAEGVFVASYFGKNSAHDFIASVLPGEVIALTNTERINAGDGTLAENAGLTLAAENKARDMAAKGYFSHIGPDGKEPWVWIKEAGYSYQSAGENLAVRFDDSADVVRAWMASPTHRANIVKPVYTEIGIGVANGMYEGSPATFVVQYFGTPLKVAVVGAAATANSSASGQGGNVTPKEATAEGGVPPRAVIAGASTLVAPVTMHTEPSAPAREAAEIFVRANDASSNSAIWIIGGIAALLMLLLVLAFFIHIEIQPVELLVGGAFVGLIALSFLGLNSSLLNHVGSQQASVIAAPSEWNVQIPAEAASIELGG